MTAIGVAVIRMWESERADRLYDDPLARAFVDAARPSFASGEPERWGRVEALAEKFFEGRTMAVRVVDDGVAAAVAGGCAQVVILGAGLDTRAYRMALPSTVTVFELDLPELFAFKEPVLAAVGAIPICVRHAVVADLRDEWPGALVANGFSAEVPTVWVDEGVLGYLSRSAAVRVVERLTEWSAPGSVFDIGRFDADSQADRYDELRTLVRGERAEPARGGLGPDVEDLLAGLGWDTRFEDWGGLVEAIGRPSAPSEPGIGMIRAVRRA
ncbi:SAM-dependent methyltransferase [Nocardia sp. NEAU-351]|uniref:S-adenosyl-L-methionine-dependent methyltransferase n=2 Tax=Nocardia bovistercoris TaxID=2785916 RepID=A0A931N0P9_9NOCA|nr:SAM-dependent methyltransferase [Nocardia bovistercoris]MBH0774907.1 SAM-dependent methyltransferase [Nocardia bovistercoris]